ncbi:hypothetical protein jhhlp_004303 [Lomentospora prolificans]|uniref:Glutamyl-tRNA amidotransferase complex subunit Gta3 domain-containing protein n=1 Tax=Lomentospora prolificans TaxID=41688 RepID=A0A2N3NB76_9PEZI|nr:hypothetical protein jhhlp_004303 [Lomentospora prolificans]
MASILRVIPRRAIRRPAIVTSTRHYTSSHIPSEPTWSTRSLLASDAASPSTSEDFVTPSQLHHLLRLSALPLPRTAEEEASLLRDLQLQLSFVRRVQACDTRGVEPLRAVRDETEAVRAESTIDLRKLAETLKEEVAIGHYLRPRRVRGKNTETNLAENWNPLQTATRQAGRYFVVKSGKEAVE